MLVPVFLAAAVLLQEGPHLPLTQKAPSSMSKSDRLVLAYYYLGEGSAHRRELHEMARANVRVALVVFRGDPDEVRELRSAARALEELDQDNKDRPRLGLFLDTRAWGTVDLSTEAGQKAIAGPLRLFYSNIPPQFWALIEGRPLVWMGPAPAGARADSAGLEKVAERASPDFGGRAPYLVLETSWGDLPSDRTYAWGASHDGPRELSVVSVGPGSREPPRDREEGAFYERSWYMALKLGATWLSIESWNGLKAGTEVCQTAALGRKYLEITERCARKFHVGDPIAPPKGPYSGKAKVLYTLLHKPHDQGLRPVKNEDGLFDIVDLGGSPVMTTRENKLGPVRYLYFDVDDSFCFFDRRSFEVAVEYLDVGEGSFRIEYDSGDPSLPPAKRRVKPSDEKPFGGSGEWRLATFDLRDAVFGNGQKGGADLRVAVERRGIVIRRISVLPK
jgi:hypothetical protein